MTVLPNPDYLHHPKLKAQAEQVDSAARIAALKLFLPAFRNSFVTWIEAERPDFGARIADGDAGLSALQETGFALLKVDPAIKAKLTALTSADFDVLEERIRGIDKPKFRDMNTELSKAENGALYDLVETAFRDLHIFDIAKAYVRRPMKIKKLFVQVNNARETSARYGAIDDSGLPSLKTNYWHIDSDIWPNIKVLIYINEVGLDQGPMRYVVGSHRDTPDFETVVRKTNDTLRLPTTQFLALPDELRLHALFGPFLKGDEPKSLEMLERERPLCGGGADLIVFDNNGVHRGGFVRSGSRRIVQCLFEAA